MDLEEKFPLLYITCPDARENPLKLSFNILTRHNKPNVYDYNYSLLSRLYVKSYSSTLHVRTFICRYNLYKMEIIKLYSSQFKATVSDIHLSKSTSILGDIRYQDVKIKKCFLKDKSKNWSNITSILQSCLFFGPGNAVRVEIHTKYRSMQRKHFWP